jgi:hypothetical protein
MQMQKQKQKHMQMQKQKQKHMQMQKQEQPQVFRLRLAQIRAKLRTG